MGLIGSASFSAALTKLEAAGYWPSSRLGPVRVLFRRTQTPSLIVLHSWEQLRVLIWINT